MEKFKFLTYLSNEDLQHVSGVVSLVETIVSKEEELKEESKNTYVYLLSDVREILETQRMNTTIQKSKGLKEDEKQEIGISLFKEYDEIDSYIQILINKIEQLVDRGLIQNNEFRIKNLRGAKVEDLYFKINRELNKNIKQDIPDYMRNMVDGEEILKFIREEFSYQPVYNTFLKDVVIDKFKEHGYNAYNVFSTELNVNNYILKNGLFLEIDNSQKVVLVIRKSVKEHELVAALDTLSKEYNEFYFVGENEKVMYLEGKAIIFKWLLSKQKDISKVKGKELHVTTLQKLNNREIWEVLRF